jgi:hypothetical protein
MIDSDFVFKGAQLTTAQVKSVTVTLDSSSIQYPEQWVTAPNPQVAAEKAQQFRDINQLGTQILQTEYVWSAEALSKYLKPGRAYDYIQYELLTTPPCSPPVQSIPMYFNGAIMTKATGVQNSIRPGSEFSDTLSAIAAGKRTSTLRSAGQFKVQVGDVVEFTGQRGQPDQRLFARITAIQSFRVPPQGIDFAQSTTPVHSAQVDSNGASPQQAAPTEHGGQVVSSDQVIPPPFTSDISTPPPLPPAQTPAELWQRYSEGLQLSPVELAEKVVIRALKEGLTQEPQLAEILQQSPYLNQFAPEERDSFVSLVVSRTSYKWRQAALDTAIAAKRLLQQHSTQLPDGARIFHGKDWRISQQNGTVSIVNIKDDRQILRMQGQEVVWYSPMPNDVPKAQWLRENYGVQEQQPSQQQSQQRGRGLCR